MKRQIEFKLKKIVDVWNHFILEYKFCNQKINFNNEVKTNYLGDIFGYFFDTLPIVFEKKQTNSYSDTFSNHISLLQSIYVQQDFIEELLRIFRCGITKGDLKSDINYSLNRGIRNELVGHPIRRFEGKLISSCLFGYGTDNEKILYLKYHKDNNYKFEKMEYIISDIISRHYNFLNTYFDKILNKLNRILKSYDKELENLKGLIEKKTFNDLIRIISIFYESIFKVNFLYDKESLEIIYDRKHEHNRYINFINTFYSDLICGIKYTQNYIQNLLEPKSMIEENNIIEPTIKIEVISTEQNNRNEILPDSYHYELGKLATKRNSDDFAFFSSCLRKKCLNNPLVISELNHMKNNFYNDIEYYTAYELICTELNEN
ncbi:hypothetical protein [Apibacter sp. HY039]|uniref:hypothetical protein n=1 Tax=Apibacter sp. HY039 TaxID=2501476 RepID=UPI000FEBD280|nr:hypothetical protein [Apibacter sp. HY039]